MRPRRAGGGFGAVRYSIARAREAGGLVALTRRLATHNACKTCAVGMSGMRERARLLPRGVQEVGPGAGGGHAAADRRGVLPRATTWRRWRAGVRASSRPPAGSGFPSSAAPGETHYRRIAWDDALDLAADALRAAPPDRTFFYASGRSSNEAAFLLQCFARAYGTNNVNNCSYYCHQASGVALTDTIGSGTATISLDDLEQADFASWSAPTRRRTIRG